ncbi:DUF447 domain-containing protein [Planctomicrobium sp. SH661]|uniref:DUF447 domain-containing protein n=1 Tax=Planctomicrobium sp. SH661 TaxID=3448124 RepID=UPI003F5C37AE
MILEGLCTTRNPDGTINIAPMGPVVNEELTSFRFRPFQTSTTFGNLKRTGCGVFHVVDDVRLIARAAVGALTDLPALIPAARVSGSVIADACRWYEFEVTAIDDSRPRSEIETRVVHVGLNREFWGFNRAKHAVLETAILATRLHLVPREEINRQLEQFAVIVDKTAGEQEQTAFAFLEQWINNHSPLPPVP